MKPQRYSHEEAMVRLRRLIEKEGSIRKFAKTRNIGHSYVAAVLLGIRPIGDKLAGMIGLRRVETQEMYEEIEEKTDGK
jgi:hypothetical protein